MGMKKKTIKKVLHDKMAEWINSVEDEEVRKLLWRDTIVTGGSIASMLLGEPVRDYDVYFKTNETAIAVSKYYINKFDWGGSLSGEVQVGERQNIKGETEERVSIFISSQGVAGQQPDEDLEPEGVEYPYAKEEESTEEKYRPVFFSENAITLSDKVQIVIRFTGEPEKIHGNYDFVHAMNYYELANHKLVLKQEALEALLSRTLIYRGSLYPVCSMFRTKKFIERGWKINASEMLKIAWQISEIDLSDPAVMREQLTGVDAAYFAHLIHVLGNASGDVSSSYVAEVIDRMNGENSDDDPI